MYEFTNVVGNESIVNAMRNAISSNKISHAYIIEGGAGSGKRLLANTFAKAIFCDSEDDPPCCICRNCRLYESGNLPDVIFVRPEKTKTLGVNDVRSQIGATIDLKPYSATHKIYIINNADTMTVAAQNALLKTLEEPPQYAVFLLLADNADLFLPTVQSRCVIFKLTPLPADKIAAHLMETLELSEDKAYFAAVCSQGSIGRAQEIAVSEDFKQLRQEVISILSGAFGRDLIDLFANAAAIDENKEHLGEILDIAAIWYRDLAIYKETQDLQRLLQRDMAHDLAIEASKLRMSHILSCIDRIYDTKRRIRTNVNTRMALDMLMLELGGKL